MKKEKFLQEVSRLRRNTNLSKSKKYDFSQLTDLNDSMAELEQLLGSAGNKIGMAVDMLDEPANEIDAAKGVYVGITNELKYVVDSLDELGVEHPPMVSGIVDGLNRYGDDIEASLDAIISAQSTLTNSPL